ncbi:SoxR reducing system RseC family protein [Thiococcus pfennigii]|jgi:sigma-E factor negative regulatory protein RseC|uniref:SoxR reducing system RseC family protein n=1 Tax=Thiococcus pfennigii TaxID=1057 RepID=UPI001907A553|nr:SoxR reducing system RseC family protein [Thiococcus pfennigii]MBK1701846.1 hypothetical protein [Thiococcus pfennigii]MBK1731246.1 hypothetical protein [Thiococcus pfennigii]
MIEESGLVVERRGAWAEVETTRRTSCGQCAVGASCGVSLLDRFLGRRPTRLAALNRIGAAPGQRVVVGIPEGALLGASLAAYLVPVLALIGGAILFQTLASRLGWPAGDALGIAGGLIGLIASLAWLARFSRARQDDARYQAVVLRVEQGPAVVLEPSGACRVGGVSGLEKT